MKHKEKNTVTVAVSLPADLAKALDDKAKELDITRSALYKLVLKNYKEVNITWQT